MGNNEGEKVEEAGMKHGGGGQRVEAETKAERIMGVSVG